MASRGLSGRAPILEIFRFELRRHLRSPLLWVGAALLFVLGLVVASVDVVGADLAGAVGRVHLNAPYAIVRGLAQLGLLAVFVSTAFAADAAVRDFDLGTHEVVFSTSVSKRDYLLGRFSGALTVAAFLLLSAGVGLALGPAAPWADPASMGAFRAWPYLWALLILGLPIVAVFAAVAFAAAAAGRAVMHGYVAVIAVLVAYLVSRGLLGTVGSVDLATLLDPTGLGPFLDATRYWTAAELNRDLPAMEGALLRNRVLWTALGLGVFALAYARFSFTVRSSGRRRRWLPWPRRSDGEPEATRSSPPTPDTGPGGPEAATVEPRHGPIVAVRQLLDRAGRQLVAVVRSVPFLVLLALGLINFTTNARSLGELTGGPEPLPLTRLMVEVVSYTGLYVLILAAIYAAELVWRERSAAIDEVTDALPAPTWILWGSTLLTLIATVALVLLLAVGVGVGVQLASGYTNLEPGLYLRGVFLHRGAPLVQFAVLALLVQVLVHRRFAGYGVLLAFLIGCTVLQVTLDLHPVLAVAGTPSASLSGVVYSDLNGYGPFATPLIWFNVLWGLECVLMLVLVHLFWVRGGETDWRSRLRAARLRWTPRVAATACAVGLAALATAGWIRYNTDVRNAYRTSEEFEALQARYERMYGRHTGLPQPRIERVRSEVDIHPHEGALEIRGSYRLRNSTDAAIPALHVTTLPFLAATSVAVEGGALAESDEATGHRVFDLSPSLAPGEARTMTFEVTQRKRGFRVPGQASGVLGRPLGTSVVENGSVIQSGIFFPSIGYLRELEVSDPTARRELALPPRRTLPSPDAPGAARRAFSAADWVDFETVVSTSADQRVVGPGDLVDRWADGGRRYFRFRVDHPYEPYWVLHSGRWEVTRDRWGDVEIAVYHDPRHSWNVRRMIEAAKLSLETYSEAFGPYPERVLRIVEMPRYGRFGAESHSTQVMISEAGAFVTDTARGRGELDTVFRLVAHEVAHEWWGNSMLAADARGRNLVVESLAEYSALLAVRRRFGEAGVRRHLRFLLERYLRARGQATEAEPPLVEALAGPSMPVYTRGAMAVHALADRVGPQAVNDALARFYADHAFSGPPFPTSLDLVARLEEAAPLAADQLVEDWFETVTTWDLRIREATVSERPDGRYAVRLRLEARKYRSTAGGADGETRRQVPIDDRIDIGIFAGPDPEDRPEGPPLYLAKHRITAADTTLEIVVDRKPEAAGIDPFHAFVDGDPDDNIARVASASPEAIVQVDVEAVEEGEDRIREPAGSLDL